eukprot:TRINITY_DN82826_c0_g1_i1.p1 TRINITY_DN82826_c0_g1~~TRINITY_DN82826_c0_g1_i1.p1  ORF type:complete len:632 (+),score=249.10 TRINITY_DN82826_c0_g1_i1:46-1941(+)
MGGEGKGKGGKGGGKGGGNPKGRGGGKKGSDEPKGDSDYASQIQNLGESIEAESKLEILRADRAQARKGRSKIKDSVREDQGIDEEDPEFGIDDGIRLEPFNMRREMSEGHFDESGHYVVNKDQEKKVTDAWLDQVDFAEKRATFQKVDRQKKATDTAAARLSSMAKNLGPDSEGEEEDEDGAITGEEEEGGEKKTSEEKKAEERARKQAEEEAAAKAAEEEAQQDEGKEVEMLEELINFLRPLEKPAEALARMAKGDLSTAREAAPALEPLKIRGRVRKARAEAEAAKAKAARDAQGGAGKKRRKLNEWGEWVEYAEAPGKEAAAESSASASNEAKTDAAPDAEKKEADAANVATSTVTNAEEVAKAAAKAEAEDRAVAEAAKAFAAEMKMTRHDLHSSLYPQQGPDAAALVNLNSEETRDVREAAVPKEEKEVEPDGAARPAPGSKKKGDLGTAEVEKKKAIERLTDLCDRLLERGCLVYDSSREQLCINIRERKGEDLEATGSGEAAKPSSEGSTSATVAAPKGEVLYSNKRFKASDGDASTAVVNLEGSAAAASTAISDSSLYWQFRWVASPEQTQGPFDSVTMQGWVTAGCFAEERPAEVRQCDSQGQPMERCWRKWDQIDFTLYV